MEITKTEWKKRINSLMWRIMMMSLAIFVNFLLANLADFNLSVEVTVFVGLILGEISKVLNTAKVSFIEE